MSRKTRVLHYINQFYAGLGGEDTASVGLTVEEKPVGPGIFLQDKLGDDYEIVATVICGDNYIAENIEQISNDILEIAKKYEVGLFVAGPGFNAGRYGMGCGATTAVITEKLKIPAVTALYSENPGTDLYKDRCYILISDNNAAKMKMVVEQIAIFSKRLVEGDSIADGKTENYHGGGPAIDIDYSTPASKRGVDMLLKKYCRQDYHTEVVMPNHEELPIPILEKPLSEAKFALVTDGGLVPKGNPDNMVPTNSKFYKEYCFGDVDALDPNDYEVSHQGYNNAFVLQDPNRLVPVDAMERLKKEGKIGDLLNSYYTTAGVMTPMEVGKKFGEGIAKDLKANGVDAVILTSTWGTSSRCGAVMTKEIERAGIPIVQVTNLTKIAEGIGSHRIMRGNSVLHVFGNPSLPKKQEEEYRYNIASEVVDMICKVPKEGEHSVIEEA